MNTAEPAPGAPTGDPPVDSAMPPLTVRMAVRAATQILTRAEVGSPLADAQLLMQYALARDTLRAEAVPTAASWDSLFLRADDPAPEIYSEWVRRRSRRVPLQHVVGAAHFYGLDFFSSPAGFIPRPETELLVEWGVTWLTNRVERYAASALGRRLTTGEIVVADVCCGPGTITLACASELQALLHHPEITRIEVLGFDISPAALELAEKNRAAIDLDPRVQVTFHQLDVRAPQRLAELGLVGCADLVLCNPPYVPLPQEEGDAPEYPLEVFHDPEAAVFAGDDGLELMADCARTIELVAAPTAAVAVEHDDSNAAGTMRALEAVGMQEITAHSDLAGKPRFVTAQVQRDPTAVPPRELFDPATPYNAEKTLIAPEE